MEVKEWRYIITLRWQHVSRYQQWYTYNDDELGYDCGN
jgi:hypothetical protein